MLLQKEVAHDVIAYAIGLGANFCELFIEKTSIQNIVYNSKAVKDISSGIDSGIGVRLIYGELALYAYSNSNKKEDLLDMVKKLAAQFSTKSNGIIKSFNFTPLQYKEISYLPKKDVILREKIEIFKKLDELTRCKSSLISQVSIYTQHSLFFQHGKIKFINDLYAQIHLKSESLAV